MRKLVVVVAAGFAVLGLLALMPLPANAELKTTISGSIRLNAHYVDRIAIFGGSEEFGPTSVPFSKGPGKQREFANDQTQIDARRTRLQFDMSDQVGSVKISGRFQGDFDTGDGNATTSNSRHFRIRLGWGQWATPGGWIVRFGQLRSLVSEYGDNLFGGVGDPDLVDENGHWDQLQARQPGVNIGWATKFMDGDLLVGVGVEKAGSSEFVSTGLSGDTGFTNGQEENIPMFGAAARYRTPLYAVFIRGAAQKQRVIFGANSDPTPGCPKVDAAGTLPTHPSCGGAKQGADTALTGWLAAISAEVTPGPLRLMGQYWYSDGLNRLSGTFADIASLVGGFRVNSVGTLGFPAGSGPLQYVRHLRAIATHNWHAGAEYKLTNDLKATAVYQWQSAVANRNMFDLQATSLDSRSFQAVHAGLIYSFWTRFDTGLEYQWGKRDTFGSTEGTVNAVNWRLRFYF